MLIPLKARSGRGRSGQGEPSDHDHGGGLALVKGEQVVETWPGEVSDSVQPQEHFGEARAVSSAMSCPLEKSGFRQSRSLCSVLGKREPKGSGGVTAGAVGGLGSPQSEIQGVCCHGHHIGPLSPVSVVPQARASLWAPCSPGSPLSVPYSPCLKSRVCFHDAPGPSTACGTCEHFSNELFIGLGKVGFVLRYRQEFNKVVYL